MAYTDDYLLNKIKIKYNELNRMPTKEEINSDKSMPNVTTYLDRFGGLNQVALLLGYKPTYFMNLSLDLFITIAHDFYKQHGRSPSVIDFDLNDDMPHSSYIRKDLGMTWNEFLNLADLPLFENGVIWQKNRQAEVIVYKLLKKQGYMVEDLSMKNTNASYSFIVNNKIKVDVRYSSPIKDRNEKYFWKFKLHLDTKQKPDYFFCLGFDDKGNHIATFLIPIEELLDKQQVVSVRINRIEYSKYSRFFLKNDNILL